ncbi:hypothetical protein LPN01_07450 [Sphingomonas sp. A2-49]|uniref:hypothetical protein n=1 Tax=Sphingomonas sp. A2-49 TaxID=1391375 RepID=UPI0021D2F8F1|nr:hypothetical protein [Sphingomonas sp. A2-49]MCU6453909.1 hypothetical protein [Sphingomonas sp. A2-49]
MTTSHLAAFGQAMARGDIETAFTHVSDRIALYSPIFEEPFVGKAAVGRVMGAVKSVVTASERTGTAQGDDRIVQFSTVTIDGVTGNGVELIQFDAEGLIDRITIFWRPLRLGLAGHGRLASLLGRDPIL